MGRPLSQPPSQKTITPANSDALNQAFPARNSHALTNKSYLHILQCLTPEPAAKSLTTRRIIKGRSKPSPASCRRGLQPDLDILGIHASQGATLSRNSHILGDLSITSLESRFCDSSSRRRPVTHTFPGSSIASRLESRFYRQLADSRDFTEIAKKLNAENRRATSLLCIGKA